MKKELKKIFSGEFLGPKLKVVEVSGEPAKYSYDGKEISEQEFNEIYKKMKNSVEFSENSEIKVLDDDGKEVSNVSYTNNDSRTSVFAKAKVGDEDFKYEQIRQKRGKLQAGGKLASSYMLISIGDKKSEYFDRQPDLSDPLLDVRDKIVIPYLDVIGGNKSLSELNVEESSVPPQPGE